MTAYAFRWFSWAVILTSLVSNPVLAQRQPIIDMHLHAQDLFVEPGAPEPLSGVRAAESTEDLQVKTLAALDTYNVVLAVTSGPRAHEYRVAAPKRIIEGLGKLWQDGYPLIRYANCSLPVVIRPWLSSGHSMTV